MSDSLIQQFILTCSPAVESAYLVYDDYIKIPLQALESEMASDSEELTEPGGYSQIAESVASLEEGEASGITVASIEEGEASGITVASIEEGEASGITGASEEVIHLCELLDTMLEECFEVRHGSETCENYHCEDYHCDNYHCVPRIR